MPNPVAPELISIIIPAKNVASVIGEQLASLVAQDYCGSWEVIVADNGSTDGTREVALSWEDRIPSLQVVDASGRAGAAHTRNVAATVARGDWIFFVDADDRASTNWLSEMVRALDGYDAIGGRLVPYIVDRNGKDVVTGPGTQDLSQMEARYLPYTGTSNLCVRAELFRKVGGFDVGFSTAGEDIAFVWRLQLAGYRLGYAAKAEVYWRERPGLRLLARQYYGYGTVVPQLFKQFRTLGMPRSSWRIASRTWARLLVRAPTVWRAESTRRLWVRDVAYQVGRVAGSVKYRVLYF